MNFLGKKKSAGQSNTLDKYISAWKESNDGGRSIKPSVENRKNCQMKPYNYATSEQHSMAADDGEHWLYIYINADVCNMLEKNPSFLDSKEGDEWQSMDLTKESTSHDQDSDEVISLPNAVNCIHLFKPLMKLHSDLHVYDMSGMVHKGLDPEDVFAMSSFFGSCLMDENIRLAMKDCLFQKSAVELVLKAAKDHIEKKTAMSIKEHHKICLSDLFGDGDMCDEKGVKHAEEMMWKIYKEMTEGDDDD
jgi:hypothetical protein